MRVCSLQIRPSANAAALAAASIERLLLCQLHTAAQLLCAVIHHYYTTTTTVILLSLLRHVHCNTARMPQLTVLPHCCSTHSSCIYAAAAADSRLHL
eukprot:2866-Heterococcus_DN1.PRE.1